jgi:hypothetical protein
VVVDDETGDLGGGGGCGHPLSMIFAPGVDAVDAA